MVKKHPQPILREEQKSSLLDEIASNTTNESNLATPAASLYMGRIDNIDENNQLWIRSAQIKNNKLTKAYSSVPISDNDIGRRCLLSLVSDGVERPVVMGWLHIPNETPEEVMIEANKKVSLVCGENQVDVTSNGVSIRGRSILSKSKSTNRVVGSSVKLN